ncbi:hypothetical protein ABZX95_32475 [Streptomyces sp. NPDC004232]
MIVHGVHELPVRPRPLWIFQIPFVGCRRRGTNADRTVGEPM